MDKDFRAGKPFTIDGVALASLGNSYATKAEAVAALPAIATFENSTPGGPLNGVSGNPLPGIFSAAADVIPQAQDAVKQAANAATDIGSAVRTFIDALGNWRMWASLGWIVLGLLLIAAGVVFLAKGEITKAIIPGVS
jgi:hypothetical protein